MQGLDMRFLGHSTVRIEMAGRVVLTDPVLTPRIGPLRRVTGALGEDAWADVDTVLISHLHGDHLHLDSLRVLGKGTPIVVPRGAGTWLSRKGFTEVSEIAPGETVEDGTLTVTATEARHSGHRWGPRLTHGPQAPAVGHLVSGGGSRIYAAGDTDLFDGMRDLGPVDVAFVPVWGWGPTLGPGHLNPERAAKAVELIDPAVAVPVHWGTLAPVGMGRSMRRLLVDPPREFAAAVARTHARTEVVVTEPGGRVLPGARSGS